MKCEMCDGDTRVIDSRRDVDSVTRRRECRICGHRFTTLEIDADWYKRLVKEGSKSK